MNKVHAIAVLGLLLFSARASAGNPASSARLFPDRSPRLWQIDWTVPAAGAPIHAELAKTAFVDTDETAPPAKATEYSHAYQVRAKIHKYASFATLPLFGTELALGQSLYNEPGSSKKTAHAIVGAGIGSLFAVNTVTGVWNLVEARKDPASRKRRLAHGLLMMAADAGFFATFLAAPGSEHGNFIDERSTHRRLAITSIGLATAGYLTMILGGK